MNYFLNQMRKNKLFKLFIGRLVNKLTSLKKLSF